MTYISTSSWYQAINLQTVGIKQLTVSFNVQYRNDVSKRNDNYGNLNLKLGKIIRYIKIIIYLFRCSVSES